MLTALQLHWKWALLPSAGSDKHRTRCRGTGCQLYDLNYLNYWLRFTRSLYNSNPVTYILPRYFCMFLIYNNYVIIYNNWLFYIWVVIFQLPGPRSGTGTVTVCYHTFRIWYLRFMLWVSNYLLVYIIYYFCIPYFIKSFIKLLLSIRYLVSLFECLF